MPELKTYHIFISHAWKYSEKYNTVVDMLDKAKNFKWKNFSVPEHDPVIDPNTNAGKKKLTKELDDQIKPVQCVIIISGMYVSHSEWIQTEIDLALKYKKPIIGLKPRGQQRIPKAVSDVAKVMVGWNTDSLVKAIRDHSL